MALPKRSCYRHPERAAIAVCVITQAPICAECSTRYEGVNYSIEGLRILQERRAQAKRGRSLLGTAVAWLATPLLLYSLYSFFMLASQFLINWSAPQWRDL